MKKFIIRAAAFCLLFVLLCTIHPMCAEATGRSNTKENITFTLYHRVDEVPVKDVEYSIYRVGNLTESGKAEFLTEFEEYGLELNVSDDLAAKDTADVLQGYILRDKIKPVDSSMTDENGVVVFPTKGTLNAGVYLICGKSYKTADGKICNIKPILTTLPYKNTDGSVVYDVKAESKCEIHKDSSKLSVLKIWDDKTTHYRPDKIQVQLINTATGEVRETVTLSKSNDWRYTWSDLPAGDTWTVVEKTVPEYYTLSFERDGYTIKLTNSSDKTYTPPDNPGNPNKPDDPDNPKEPESGDKKPERVPVKTEKPIKNPAVKLPQTGTLWWPVPILASMGMIFIIIGILHENREDLE